MAGPNRPFFFHMERSKQERLFQEPVVFEVLLLQNTATTRTGS